MNTGSVHEEKKTQTPAVKKRATLQNTPLAKLTRTKNIIEEMTLVKYFILLQREAYVYIGVQQLHRYFCLKKGIKKENVTLDVQYV